MHQDSRGEQPIPQLRGSSGGTSYNPAAMPKRIIPILFGCVLAFAVAEKPPLLDEVTVAALEAELSGEAAKRNLEYMTRLHRTRGSRQFRAAAEHILAQLKEYGISPALDQFPADGKIYYGAQRSRPAWNAEFAELWELRQEGGGWTRKTRLGSWEAAPMSLAQDSASADVTAELVDVGSGTREQDYAGKEVRGKIVLASAQPGAVAELAVERFGAAGIVSYAQNQQTAWYGENENLVRWGHMETFAAKQSFGFMISLKQARALQRRLAAGDPIRLHAVVKTTTEPGTYDIVNAVIPGSDPALRAEEIVFSCHLDHPRPGANDNASGCSAILEVARAFAKLIREKRIAAPARTLRFVWPPEIEGTHALLQARPEWARRIKAVVHMDMVGGGPETKAVFHVTRGPASLPSFVYDVASIFGEYVNRESEQFAATGRAAHPVVSVEGGKEALQGEVAEFNLGSDHMVYTSTSFGIPAVYFNDWPDRYIHTTGDVPANIDPTKLKRAGFIGAATAYYLANFNEASAAALWPLLEAESLRRTALMIERRARLDAIEAANITRFHLWHETEVARSLERFAKPPQAVASAAAGYSQRLSAMLGKAEAPGSADPSAKLVFARTGKPHGTLITFGHNHFTDRYGAANERQLKLLNMGGGGALAFNQPRGSGPEYAYELLNLVDGRRTAMDIRNDVAAIWGPVQLEHVVEYLRALAEIGVIEEKK